MSASQKVTPKTEDAFSFVTNKSGSGENIDTNVSGLYHHCAIFTLKNVTIDSDEIDVEFSIPFDNNTEANEAELTIYNLSYNTTNQINRGDSITVKAGYGDDLGVIFQGTISDKSIENDHEDRIITLHAIDGAGLESCEAEVEYAAGNTAQAILYDLVVRLGLPIASWYPVRDSTFDSTVSVDGSLMDAIKKYAWICGVSAYVCKGSIYVHPLSYDGSTSYDLSVDTGLLSTEEYEKEVTNGDYTDTVKGWELEMLLNPQVQTGTRINLTSSRANGTYYVQEGEHNFNGDDMTTTVTAISG